MSPAFPDTNSIFRLGYVVLGEEKTPRPRVVSLLPPPHTINTFSPIPTLAASNHNMGCKSSKLEDDLNGAGAGFDGAQLVNASDEVRRVFCLHTYVHAEVLPHSVGRFAGGDSQLLPHNSSPRRSLLYIAAGEGEHQVLLGTIRCSTTPA